MGKTSKKKTYTEDVVLNKILKEISEENLERPHSSSPKHSQKNAYEDDLVKHYREKDAAEARQKYINIAKIIVILCVIIVLIFLLTNENDTTLPNKQTQAKKIIAPSSIPQDKIKKINIPIEVESKIKEVPYEIIPTPIKKPVKTERELAKKMLLQQMQN
ncbi:MAG: hypothetical protein DRQ78_11340 [Epsilonproteobacteria bacterium]|nr:MAG: hypothetical protein DRQ78_11340 [Campylobacterota bacterium]